MNIHTYNQDFPVLEQTRLVSKALSLLTPWILRLSCLVVGPGLGDDPLVVATAAAVIRYEGKV